MGGSLTNLANHQHFAKLKTSKLVVTIENLLADLLIRQTIFLPKSLSIHFHQILSLSNFPSTQYMLSQGGSLSYGNANICL